MSQVNQTYSRIDQWADRMDRMPRTARIILSLAITLELVVLAWLIVAELFGIDIMDSGSKTTVPLLLVLVLGIVFYVVGWWAMVGFDTDPNRPWHAGSPAVLYLAAGAAGLIVLLLLALFGLALGYVL